jgi:hypothetical protein
MRLTTEYGALAMTLMACVRSRDVSSGAASASPVATTSLAAARGPCVSERLEAQRRADSVLAIPATLWRPSATDDTLRIARARRSGVVAQVLVDTAGAPVMKTFRVLAADYPQFGEPASRMLEPMRFAPASAGSCTVPSVLVIPFEFSVR